MGNKIIFHTLESKKSLVDIKAATKRSLSMLGGTLVEYESGFQLKQGATGVSYAFAANFDASINVRQIAPDKYELTGTIQWSPNGLFWGCLIVGAFVFGVLWIVPILYLFIDPMQAYQQAFIRVGGLV